jgi:hypothetical protein
MFVSVMSWMLMMNHMAVRCRTHRFVFMAMFVLMAMMRVVFMMGVMPTFYLISV